MRGVAEDIGERLTGDKDWQGRTAEETTGDGSDDDLQGKQATHPSENGPALLVNGVDADDMDGRAHSQEDGSADGFEEVEVGAGLGFHRKHE